MCADECVARANFFCCTFFVLCVVSLAAAAPVRIKREYIDDNVVSALVVQHYFSQKKIGLLLGY